MLQEYPEAANANSEYLWSFLETRLDEVLRALPEAAGVVLYTDEPSDLILYELKGVNHGAVLKRLLDLEFFVHRLLFQQQYPKLKLCRCLEWLCHSCIAQWSAESHLFRLRL